MKKRALPGLCLATAVFLTACGGNTKIPSSTISSDGAVTPGITAESTLSSRTEINPAGNWQISRATRRTTGEECSLTEIYGSGISNGGTLSLKKDGTFSKYIGITSDDRDAYEGIYEVKDESTIVLTYRNGNAEEATYLVSKDGTEEIQLTAGDKEYTIYFVKETTK